MNRTRKNKKGGSISDFSSDDIFKRLNNYLGASYAIKQASDILLNNIKSNVIDTRISKAIYKSQSQNAEDFLKISNELSKLTHQFKNNILQLAPSPVPVTNTVIDITKSWNPPPLSYK